MGKLSLYGVTLSPFVRKVKILLMEKGIDHEHEQATPSQEPEFLKISPTGKIPALLDEEGRSINDSSVMVNYLEERFTESPMLPKDPYDRACARWFEEYADSTICPKLVFAIFGQKIIHPYAFGIPTDEEVVKAGLEAAPKILSYLENEIKGKNYFVNNTYGLADISLASTFCCLRHADFNIDAGTYPELSKWFLSIIEREFYRDMLEAETTFIGKLKAKAAQNG